MRNFIPAIWLILSSAVMQGQGFGRNKVLYEDFNFRVKPTPHFSIHHYFDTITATRMAYLSERWYQRYESLLRDTFRTPLPVIFYADHPDFQQTEVISGLIDVGTGGVTESLKNRLVMPLAGSYSSTEHVLGHEMAHMFQYHMLRMSDSLSMESIYQVPLWMVEGMAEYLSLGSNNTLTAMWMRDAVMQDNVPTLREVSYDYRYNPYRYGHAIWAFIAGYWGDGIIPVLFMNSAKLGFEQGIRATLNMSEDSLSKLWIKALKETYSPQIVPRTKPYAIGKNVFAENKQGGEYYLGPSISPDGSKVVFYSEREIFSIDIYLADAESGKIIRKLGKREGNEHYDELNFIYSSGTWSPDSKNFAHSVYSEGDNKIIITDIATGDIIRTIRFPSIGSIYSADWSPDGKFLVFSATGTNSRMADLYLYELGSGSLQQLTNDLYADLHPAWSPDGSTIAFTSDRGRDTDTSRYIFGKMHICLYNLKEKNVRVMNLFRNTMHINPQFSPDGKAIIFIADPDGINNIYRSDLSGSEILKVTHVATGISGLTELSPALTVARETGDMLFTVYDNMQLKGYTLFNEQSTATQADTALTTRKLNFLPPENRKTDYVNDYVDSPASTTVARQNIRKNSHPYQSRLGLDFVGGLYGGAGFSQYGTALQGGVFFRFADVLNRHILNTGIQVNGRLADIAGMGMYINQKNRFHWGAYASHIPYLSSFVNLQYDTLPANGSSVIFPVIEQDILRTFEERLALLGSYPLSKTRRWDFYVAETYVSYSRRRTSYYPIDAPVENLSETQRLPAPSPLYYTSLSAAYVGDNSFFAITDPMKGSRYRIEAEGIINSFRFANVLADYRKYFFVKPLSFAFRALHYGRYFKDSENETFAPLYLGNEYFIRGYSIFSFQSDECNGDSGPGRCPVYDRLMGSKIGVVNAEIRLPFTGPERLAIIKSRFLYSSLNLFADGGAAWTRNSAPEPVFASRSGQRIPVFSTGISYRINVSGVVVFEFYYAYPFQRPVRGWHFGFQIMPGW